jgi:hypothetical protein
MPIEDLSAGSTLKSDLHSNEPIRIQMAMRSLVEKMNPFENLKLPPFGFEVLLPFGEKVAEEVQLDFLAIITGYRYFTPRITQPVQTALMIALVLQYAEFSVAFNVALKLKISKNPVQRVVEVMREIMHQGVHFPVNTEGTGYLVSCLLDGNHECAQRHYGV